MVDAVLALPEGTKLMVLLAPVVRDRKGEFRRARLPTWQAQGYVRFRVDGQVRGGEPMCRR